MVGCVVVRDGAVVGEGFHAAYGGPHAEIHALREAGERASGSTCYVSLEPCSHHGKTPPCTEALIAAGVRRVVFGAADPGAESSGGAERLRAAGIAVAGPAFDRAEARRHNPAFFAAMEGRSPWIAGKLAVSADGFISERPGARTAISSVAASEEVHRVRSGFDAIVVGGVTARVDDPMLTVRTDPPPASQPVRVVLTTEGRIARDSALSDTMGEAGFWVFVGERASGAAHLHLESEGAEVVTIRGLGSDDSLHEVAEVLGRGGCGSVLCEGGGRLMASFLRAGLLDRLYLFESPDRLGPEGVPAFPGLEGHALWRQWTPIGPPTRFGRDTLTILDREPDSGSRQDGEG